MEAVPNILVRVVAEVRRRRRLVASVSGVIAIVALLLAVIVRHGGPSQMASGVSRTMSEAKNIVAGTIASGITAIKQQLAKSTSDSEALRRFMKQSLSNAADHRVQICHSLQQVNVEHTTSEPGIRAVRVK